MNEEEFKECSVIAYPSEIRFLHIKGGHISYHVDRHISDYVNKLQEENQQLKEQLEDMTLCRDIASGHRKEVQDRETILLSQQKEFIEWLESNLEALEMCDRELILTNNKKEIKAYKEVLSKYKEIIGDEEEDELNG